MKDVAIRHVRTVRARDRNGRNVGGHGGIGFRRVAVHKARAMDLVLVRERRKNRGNFAVSDFFLRNGNFRFFGRDGKSVRSSVAFCAERSLCDRTHAVISRAQRHILRPLVRAFGAEFVLDAAEHRVRPITEFFPVSDRCRACGYFVHDPLNGNEHGDHSEDQC